MNQLEVCKHCDFLDCMAIILDHPEQVVKCIHFGHLKRYVDSIELPSEFSILSLKEFNQCGGTSFIFTLGEDTK